MGCFTELNFELSDFLRLFVGSKNLLYRFVRAVRTVFRHTDTQKNARLIELFCQTGQYIYIQRTDILVIRMPVHSFLYLFIDFISGFFALIILRKERDSIDKSD